MAYVVNVLGDLKDVWVNVPEIENCQAFVNAVMALSSSGIIRTEYDLSLIDSLKDVWVSIHESSDRLANSRSNQDNFSQSICITVSEAVLLRL